MSVGAEMPSKLPSEISALGANRSEAPTRSVARRASASRPARVAGESSTSTVSTSPVRAACRTSRTAASGPRWETRQLRPATAAAMAIAASALATAATVDRRVVSASAIGRAYRGPASSCAARSRGPWRRPARGPPGRGRARRRAWRGARRSRRSARSGWRRACPCSRRSRCRRWCSPGGPTRGPPRTTRPCAW